MSVCGLLEVLQFEDFIGRGLTFILQSETESFAEPTVRYFVYVTLRK